MHKSYRSGMSIERPESVSADEGARYIEYWTNAIVSDLHRDLNDPNLLYALPEVARKAHRWFEDAWRGAGADWRRFPINWFVIEVFEDFGHRGRMLAQVDVMAGTFRELS